MIPLRLTLQNFLSYGSEPQTIDFSGYNLICLSGKNGHGKSALLDAITWAVWGHARKTIGTTKADAGLIRLGQSKMMVVFEFISTHTTYRVRRECNLHYEKTYTTLDFALYDQHSKTFCPLTEKTLRKTQEKIETSLQLSYDSFCNSALLRQGNSNEFSVKSPRDRKQIIASILGIDQYETLRKEAQKRHRTLQVQLQTIDALVSRLGEKQAGETDLKKISLQLMDKLKALVAKKEELERKYKITQRQSLRLQKHALTIAARTKSLQEKDKQKKELLQKLTHIRRVWKETQKKRLSNTSATALQSAKRELKAHIARLEQAERTKMELERMRFQLIQQKNTQEQQIQKDLQIHKEKWTQQLQLIEAELNSQKNTLNRFETEIRTTKEQLNSYSKQLDDIAQKQIICQKKKALLDTNKQKLERYQKQYLLFSEREKRLEKEASAVIERIHIASGSHEYNHCPLCKQALTHERRRCMIKDNLRRACVLSHQLYRLNRVCPTLNNALGQRAQLGKDITRHQTTNAQLHATCTMLKQRTKEAKQQLSVCTAQQKQYRTKVDELREKKQLALSCATQYKSDPKQQQELDACRTSLHALEIKIETMEDTSQLPKLRETIQTLEEKLDESRLEAVLPLQEQRLEQTSEYIRRIKQLRAHSGLLQQLEQWQQCNTMAQQKTLKAAQHYEELLTHIIQEIQDHAAKRERISANLEALSEAKREEETLKKQKQEISQQAEDLNTIATALSKDGIQALLIEQTLPDIEHEANKILAQLTDNQTQIMIESLKDLKKGGTKETLDIKISDEHGIRPYEMFSGGEAFRIDFALRIALSKLLALRSGAQLETLIIDEGFGSQDAQGLAHIMDTLYQVQDQFSKIIIVSHLTDLKDQFPVHFVVNKGSNGSTISIKKNG